jgi:hypothetical protein
MNSSGYIVPFLTISSILIDVCFSNLIFIGAIFNSYNYWYLLSYSNQFTLHYSILLLLVFILYPIAFSLLINNKALSIIYPYISLINSVFYYSLFITYSSLFTNYTFFIPIFLDFFLIFSTFFFIGPINSIEVFTGFNSSYSILFTNIFSMFFQIDYRR